MLLILRTSATRTPGGQRGHQGRRELASDNAIVASVRDVISAEAIEEGEPVRAVDVLMVVTTLLAVVPQPPVSLPRVAQREPRWPGQF